MKTTKWLNKQEAEKLGFEVKESEKGRTKARYNLDDKQLNKLDKLTLSVGTETKPNDYKQKELVLSAWGEDNKMMCIDTYCRYYNLPRKDITSYKLVSHTGTPYYNIVFK